MSPCSGGQKSGVSRDMFPLKPIAGSLLTSLQLLVNSGNPWRSFTPSCFTLQSLPSSSQNLLPVCFCLTRLSCRKTSYIGSCVHVCRVPQSCLFVNPWTTAHGVPLSLGFSWQKYWSGIPFPTQGDFPNPGIELASLASPTLAAEFLTISTTGEAHIGLWHHPIPCASHVAQWVKNLPANAGDSRDVGSVPGSGRSPGEGDGYPLQYSCLENPMAR